MRTLAKFLFLMVASLCLTALPLAANPVFDLLDELNVYYKTDLKREGVLGLYSPYYDRIRLLPSDQYESEGEENSTILHELGHWAHHDDRLGVVQVMRDGTPEAYEEVIVEVAACIAADLMDVARDPDHKIASYLQDRLNEGLEETNNRPLTDAQYGRLLMEIDATVEYLLKEEVSDDTVAQYMVRLEVAKEDSNLTNRRK